MCRWVSAAAKGLALWSVNGCAKEGSRWHVPANIGGQGVELRLRRRAPQIPQLLLRRSAARSCEPRVADSNLLAGGRAKKMDNREPADDRRF